MTQWVINRSDTDGVDKITLFNSDAPSSAFHYCYGKNKRNYNGSVSVTNNTGWYMPGIRELEAAIVQYYNDFEDFRGKLYWSASAASGNNNGYARATKVNVSGTGENVKAQYVNSANNGEEGYVARTGRALRIRAFYRKN